MLYPKLCESVDNKLVNKQSVYSKYIRQVRDLKPLVPQQDVTMYNHVQNQWEHGQIVDVNNAPHSYMVQNEAGHIVRRNRVDLKESPNTFVSSRAPEHVDNPAVDAVEQVV